jgi:hypothetical protein
MVYVSVTQVVSCKTRLCTSDAGCFLHNMRGIFNHIKVKINVNYIPIFSPYRAVSTLRLAYKNQSVNAV